MNDYIRTNDYFNSLKLSNSAKKLITNKIGYRTEDFSGSRIRDISEVCIFETFELENIDILAYIIEHYNFMLSENEKTLLENIFFNKIDITEKDKKMFGNICKRISVEITGNEDCICVWLCSSKNNFYDNYLSHKSYDEVCFYTFDEYIIPDNFCILSDLDSEGILIAF